MILYSAGFMPVGFGSPAIACVTCLAPDTGYADV